MSIEWVIICMGATYAFIEAVQLILLIHQTKRTADTLSRLLDSESEEAGIIATNFFVGMSNKLRTDPAAQQAFGEFIAWCGACAFQQAQKAVEKTMKPPKIKTIGDLIGLAFQMPAVQAAAEKKAAEIVGGAAEKAGEKVIQGWGL